MIHYIPQSTGSPAKALDKKDGSGRRRVSLLLTLLPLLAVIVYASLYIRVFSHGKGGLAALHHSSIESRLWFGQRHGGAASADAVAAKSKSKPKGLGSNSQLSTLRFQVCNGFANQRLSIVYAALFAKKLGRALVLPKLVRTGTQTGLAQVYASDSNSSPFGAMYDEEAFVQALAQHDLKVLADEDAPAADYYVPVNLAQLDFSALSALKTTYARDKHVAVNCPLFKIFPTDLTAEDQGLMKAVLSGLQPAPNQLREVQKAVSKLQQVAGPGGLFNVLHLRMEEDWQAHCWRWEHLGDGIIRNNCYNNTESIHNHMKVMGFSSSVPVYVAAFWPDVNPDRNATVMARLAKANYTIVTSASLLSHLTGTFSREELALIEYSIALEAYRFMGNSVSTFSALALLERRNNGRWAAYYNGGNIPITFMLPGLHLMPWVFTYNSWSPAYDYMLKAAVRSAEAVGGLQPYCIFIGDTASPIYTWLVAHNVTMIEHVPKWRDALLARAKDHMKENVAYSHLYKTPDMLVSTFQRVDIAVMPVLNQYSYVLYTDADVFFRKPVTLDSFGLPLPDSVAMSYEFREGSLPYNAGIMLMNLPALRRTYRDFMRFIMSNKNGLWFERYGPADQGAFNQFYEKDVVRRMLDQRFNTKPYHDRNPDSSIVHFHGPKPHEFLTYVETGKCDFYWMCELAWTKSLCSYLRDWAAFEKEPSHARMHRRLMDACTWLDQQQQADTWTGLEQPTETMKKLHAKRWSNEAGKRR